MGALNLHCNDTTSTPFTNRNKGTQTHQPHLLGYPPRPHHGRTSLIRPSQRHYFDIHFDVPNARITSTLCRCHTPSAHGNASTLYASAGHDIHGEPLDWQEFMTRVLEHYGAPTVSHEEEVAALRHVMDAETARFYEEYYARLARNIGRGVDVGVGSKSAAKAFWWR
jgi:hypothetical protein